MPIQLTTTEPFACCVAHVKLSLVPNKSLLSKGKPRLQSKLQPNGEAINLYQLCCPTDLKQAIIIS